MTNLEQQSVDIHALWHKIGWPKFGVTNVEHLPVKLKHKKFICNKKGLRKIIVSDYWLLNWLEVILRVFSVVGVSLKIVIG